MTTDFLDAYDAERLRLVILPPGSKRPNGKWQTGTVAELAALLGAPQNLGVVYDDGLAGLDCDTPQRWQEITARLAGLGVNTWHVRRPENGSPHDGGGTAVLRLASPAAGRSAPGIDVKTAGYSLVPSSTHPAGGAYYFPPGHAPADVPIITVDWRDLAPLFAPQEPTPLATPHELAAGIRGQRVPPLARAILAGDVATIARYATRSEAAQAAVASMANAGWSFDEIAEQFIGARGTGRFRQEWHRNPKRAIDWLERSYHKAVTFIAANPHPVRERALELRRRAEQMPWPGRCGGTDRAVTIALATIAARACREPFTAAIREVAELAGVHRNTAYRALERLEAQGVIERTAEPSSPDEPAAYRLRDTLGRCIIVPISHSVVTKPEYGTSMHAQNASPGHDVYRWHGLGKSAHAIMAAMAEGIRYKVRELAEATGKHPGTVRRNLRRLESVGLVEPCGGDENGRNQEYMAASCVRGLDEIAEAIGTAGAGQRQREAHERQRAAHRAKLEEWRREREQ